MIRQLKLYNARNDLIDLVNERWIFGTEPEDLGVEISNEMFNVNANAVISEEELLSKSLKLTMYYGLEKIQEYKAYNTFVNFLNYPPYTFIYSNDSIEDYRRECVLNTITKPDINLDGVLIGELILDFTTPFYKEISERYSPYEDSIGDGKIYAGDNKPRNLIANPNFENNMQDWDYSGDLEGKYQVLTPTTDKPNSNILKLTSSNNKQSSFMNLFNHQVVKGERLSFRVDIKADSNPDYDRPVINVSFGEADRNYKYSDFGITSSSDFKTGSISFVAPTDGIFSLMLLNQNLSTAAEMSTYFREPMLISGDISDLPIDFYSGKPFNSDYVYPYIYESDYNGKSGVFNIENNSIYIGSSKGSPVEITVHGPCTNPYWEILEGSKILQSDGYNIDVPEGYRLVVSSIVQNQRVKLIAPDGTVSDVYKQQDLTRSNFVTIPEGLSTLAFHNVNEVTFKYREEYVTV
ncbi:MULTISPECIES: phage distal tail protein domain-containing protein [unclassified Enterococcus]|uniref:phage distal tail protein domain-containing protein n=1 Tax=unclassified Enterococcus TaxID=2608891 RepID=UPI0015531A74|nr:MULTISPECIES: phage distal tail protein domain-containing protein [unclassified Enterococcus]MBS7578289.1 phage baseplate protein [Enterococcus sp. MMGLQ5-2]MBS7585500.1 phage baseplate protein [Enterococcus sp. MMGLQ5-1]NPD13357.1 phage baseplate protein [Enterococcus sp. MMGLQ5-1]NPD38120.1 phage baseplate protein [Enterococcus sp. MMGLQ5-2]